MSVEEQLQKIIQEYDAVVKIVDQKAADDEERALWRS